MKSIGAIPKNISLLHALDSIGETIIISDKDYNILWMNSNATELLSQVAPLFGLSSAEDLIGVNMNYFHRHPEHQRDIMDRLSGRHRARINIRDRFVADIVITPIVEEHSQVTGYIVMLMDVTTKAEEDKEKEKLISALSVPMIKIWENTIAIPLIGEFDNDRADRLISSLLKEAAAHNIHYVLVDLSGLYQFNDQTKFYIQKLYDSPSLLGTQCILVGITPELAMAAGELNRSILSFHSAHAGLKFILDQKE
ncbi:RsbR, positive regulator of sigma-B [Bacillus sp. M6-12]|uniref:PAS domain-containing protein n=1 Tax=Bacillus sp. M6-12 TaxID=2054166 RepID=UPI000C7748B7|nr:PAS domain-containing protein [Bacillus sp. M6-12]PLS18524.1 RsbR, positive regulator of sigma-B [Bacillus sp. M6-12]